jgi:hypothetical protein
VHEQPHLSRGSLGVTLSRSVVYRAIAQQAEITMNKRFNPFVYCKEVWSGPLWGRIMIWGKRRFELADYAPYQVRLQS